MLLSLAQSNPGLLHLMGASPEMIQRELQRYESSKKWKAMSPQDKAVADKKLWSNWLQQYGQRLQREVQAGATAAERVAAMRSSNPRLVLRNWIAQEAIAAAEKGDYSYVRDLLEALRRPYDEEGEGVEKDSGFREGVADGEMVVEEQGEKEEHGVGSIGHGKVCVLKRRFGGKAPEWADTLCVTCSS